MSAPSGWRGRVGMVHPSRGDVLMYEFYRAIPPGIVMVPASLNLHELSGSELDRVIDGYEAAVKELAYERVDLVILGGSPPVTYRGHGFEQQLIERAKRHVSVPVLALIRCEVEALRAVGAKRIAIGAPYTEALTAKFAAYFTAEGFEVVATRCLGIATPVDMALLPHDRSAQLARELRAAAPTADSIHLTCPRWPTLANLEGLERELGVPVTSSSQSAVFATLRHLGIADRVSGFGSLLARD